MKVTNLIFKNSRLILIELLEFAESVGEGVVLLGGGGSSETGADAFLLLQRPVNDDRVDQILSFGGEGLGQQIAEAAGVNDSEEGEGLSAGDVFEHRGALKKTADCNYDGS